jgi:transposase
MQAFRDSRSLHVLKSGGCWVDAPSAYGPRNTLYKRFVCWTTKGVWADIFQTSRPLVLWKTPTHPDSEKSRRSA